MKKGLKITLQAFITIAFISVIVFCQILLNTLQKERGKVEFLQKLGSINKEQAKSQLDLAQQLAAEAEMLRTQLEICRAK